MTATVLHLQRPVLVGPDDVRDQAWVVGGRLTFERAVALPARTCSAAGWVLPGLVDAHCHVGLDAHGAVDDASRRGARRSPTATPARCSSATPALPPTPAGSTTRDDLPRIIRAGRHIARPRRYIRNFAHEVEPERARRARAARGPRRRRLGQARRRLDRPRRRRPVPVLAAPTCSADAIAAAHEEGARVTAHCFGEESLRDLAAAGTDCIEHATGLEPTTPSHRSRRRASRSSRPWSTSTPSRRSPSRPGRSSPTTTGTCSTCTSGATRRSRAAHEAGRPRLRRHRRRWLAAARAGRPGGGRARRRPGSRRHEALDAAAGGRARGSAAPGWRRARSRPGRLRRRPARRPRRALAAPSLVVLRGRPLA